MLQFSRNIINPPLFQVSEPRGDGMYWVCPLYMYTLTNLLALPAIESRLLHIDGFLFVSASAEKILRLQNIWFFFVWIKSPEIGKEISFKLSLSPTCSFVLSLIGKNETPLRFHTWLTPIQFAFRTFNHLRFGSVNAWLCADKSVIWFNLVVCISTWLESQSFSTVTERDQVTLEDCVCRIPSFSQRIKASKRRHGSLFGVFSIIDVCFSNVSVPDGLNKTTVSESLQNIYIQWSWSESQQSIAGK